MIYRVLGVVALIVGGIFGLVALLVLLPFIDNFNTSLLVLCGVFGILAYVFLAIGWQLFHPPGSARSSGGAAALKAESAAAGVEAHAGLSAAAGHPPVVAEPTPSVSSSVGPVEAEVEKNVEEKGEDEHASAAALHLSPNGGDADQAHPVPGRFKKPGAPVPHK